MKYKCLDYKILWFIGEFIDSFYCDNKLCAKELSRKFGLNYKNLIAEFKELYGEPINKRVNRLRIKKAKEWLKKEYLSINFISEGLGFNSRTNFYRVFKEANGLSPEEYRNRH